MNTERWETRENGEEIYLVYNSQETKPVSLQFLFSTVCWWCILLAVVVLPVWLSIFENSLVYIILLYSAIIGAVLEVWSAGKWLERYWNERWSNSTTSKSPSNHVDARSVFNWLLWHDLDYTPKHHYFSVDYKKRFLMSARYFVRALTLFVIFWIIFTFADGFGVLEPLQNEELPDFEIPLLPSIAAAAFGWFRLVVVGMGAALSEPGEALVVGGLVILPSFQLVPAMENLRVGVRGGAERLFVWAVR